ncbi:uncharacterized protein LOC131887755 isoform X2 [Tigriopus californicus]|uniref:uncharacterized protein LOC131887755 isoform X2 n=1 Tax=Tigriopus californicus TaxID=6832 RepID=UPI0027D9EE32|nr:uncharacterized protein LOC131887755 isoform X2 [Tigriopus californicus]XP_059092414.1 uncharacterized protein LOC131887755 isoform X2 [Tigriopus californicus]
MTYERWMRFAPDWMALWQFKMEVKEATEYCQYSPVAQDDEFAKPDLEYPTIHRNPWLNQFVQGGQISREPLATNKLSHGPPLAHSQPQNVPLGPHQSHFHSLGSLSNIKPPYYPYSHFYSPGRPSPTYYQSKWMTRNRRQSPLSSSHADDNGQELNQLRNNIISKVSNVTCILTRMNYLDDKGLIAKDSLKANIQKMPLDEIMKAELVQSVDTCAKFSSCLPLEEFETVPIAKTVAPAVLFVNCLKGKRIEVCIKKDLRDRLRDLIQSDVQDTEGVLSRSDPLAGIGQAAIPLPQDQEEMDTFVFALLYEDEPKSIYR